jgi:hypothetical protein
MAITNAQQYQQLVNKPANGKRPGYRGDDAYGSRSRSNQATSSRAATSTSNVSPGAGNSRRGNDGPDDRSSARQTYNTAIATGRNPTGIDLSKGPPPLTEKEKQFVKDNPPKATLADFLDPRKRFYNYARNLPGAKKSSYNNLKAYRDYLVSQGADLSTIDRLMEGVDEENAIGFDPFQELAYGYEPKGIEDIETLRELFGSVDESEKYKPPTTMGPFDKITAVPQNFSDFMLTQRNNPNLFAAGDLGNFMDTPKPKDLVNPNTGELYTNAEWNDLKRDIGQDRGLMGGSRDDAPDDPCKGPNPPAYCFVNNDPTEEEDATPDRNLGGLAPRFGGSIFNFDNLADGGRAGMMDGGMMEDTPEGGIMDLESGRQMYFLGKLVKKATRAVKKVAKSPFGKAALLYGLGSLGASALGKYQAGTGSSFFSGLKGKLLGQAGSRVGEAFVPYKEGLLTKLGLTKGGGSFMPTLKGGITLGLGIPALMDLFGKKEDEGFDIDDYYKSQGINIADVRMNPYNYLSARNQGSMFAADGGLMRTGYQEGGDAEPVAKKTMPLLDMDGMEKDYREEGGFVPIGRMERADDVPARLSKNEFVFTADAVRNAGEGDIDKGAEVMYNMMKNLESGGEVSEESQGLDGAKEMFKTSQRLEEVL